MKSKNWKLVGNLKTYRFNKTIRGLHHHVEHWITIAEEKRTRIMSVYPHDSHAYDPHLVTRTPTARTV